MSCLNLYFVIDGRCLGEKNQHSLPRLASLWKHNRIISKITTSKKIPAFVTRLERYDTEMEKALVFFLGKKAVAARICTSEFFTLRLRGVFSHFHRHCPCQDSSSCPSVPPVALQYDHFCFGLYWNYTYHSTGTSSNNSTPQHQGPYSNGARAGKPYLIPTRQTELF